MIKKIFKQKERFTYLKIAENYQMMFLHPKAQVEPYSPNFVVLMHQLLSSKQPEPEVTFPVMLSHVTKVVKEEVLIYTNTISTIT